MMKYNELTLEYINKSAEILDFIPKINYDAFREQLMNNSVILSKVKSLNDIDRNLVANLDKNNKQLIKYFYDNNWRFTINDFDLLNFIKIYKSQLKFHIEWHAGTAFPHPLIYYIQFKKNGFFNITSSHPKFELNSLKVLNSQKINFKNIFKIPVKGEIELKSHFFNLEGRIIGDMIVDKNINFTDYNDGDRIVDSNMLHMMNNENAT